MLVRSARSLHRPPFLLRTIPRQGRPSQPLLRLAAGPISSRRRFHLSPLSCKGLQPDSSDPQPPNIETAEGTGHLCKAATISVEEYHEIADEYIEDLLLALEEQAEVAQSGYEVEYSVCSSNEIWVEFPPPHPRPRAYAHFMLHRLASLPSTHPRARTC